MSFRSWFERVIWPPRDASPVFERCADVFANALGRALEGRDRDIAWLQVRNAELTAELIGLAKAGKQAQPFVPELTRQTVDVVTFPPEVVEAIRAKAGARWERSELGRELAMFASTSLSQNRPVSEIVEQIEQGESSWS